MSATAVDENTGGTFGASIASVVAGVRRAYDSGVTRPLEWRRKQLQGLIRMLREREAEFGAALAQDLGKNPLEGYLTEISITASEAEYALKHLAQ